MSKEYNEYLKKHIDNVQKAATWIIDNIRPELNMTTREIFDLLCNVQEHDRSKYSEEEYDAYDGYFYLDAHDADAFNRAWLHHIHNNMHHWQYWLLMMDDGKYREPGKIVALEVPKQYVIEMIADWWSFSWSLGNLFEIFNWYEEHRDCIVLHDDTRKYLEHILDAVRTKLELELGN